MTTTGALYGANPKRDSRMGIVMQKWQKAFPYLEEATLQLISPHLREAWVVSRLGTEGVVRLSDRGSGVSRGHSRAEA